MGWSICNRAFSKAFCEILAKSLLGNAERFVTQSGVLNELAKTARRGGIGGWLGNGKGGASGSGLTAVLG